MNQDALSEFLQGKRIALVGCTAIEATIAGALKHAHASFANIDPKSVHPGDSGLDRFDALVLGICDESDEAGWLRPEALGKHGRPLMLTGTPEDISRRETLQSLADDVLLTPFTECEVLLRLHRITDGKCSTRKTVQRSGKPIVLVVDDDLNITNYLESVLRNLDVEMHVATDGKSALAAARQLLPDLLLLDIGLPAMNGLEVLRCLRNDPGTSSVATALLTSSSDPADIRHGASLNILDYILKPFGHINLVRRLKALIPRQAQFQSAPMAV